MYAPCAFFLEEEGLQRRDASSAPRWLRLGATPLARAAAGGAVASRPGAVVPTDRGSVGYPEAPCRTESQPPTMGEQWICAHCGDVIGVYEPAVVIEDDEPRETSRANEPELERTSLYHADCWRQRAE
jgi:hypothetical protein